MTETPRTAAAIEEYRKYGGSPQNEPVFSSDLAALERELTAVTGQRDNLAKASKSLLHYVKLARKGDSPLIHATIVESIDLEITKLEESLNQIPTTPLCPKEN